MANGLTRSIATLPGWVAKPTAGFSIPQASFLSQQFLS